MLISDVSPDQLCPEAFRERAVITDLAGGLHGWRDGVEPTMRQWVSPITWVLSDPPRITGTERACFASSVTGQKRPLQQP